MAMTIYKEGSRGEGVRLLQRQLCVYPDGVFGGITREAFVKFQTENGLKADGIVGAATMAMLAARAGRCAFAPKKSRRRITKLIVHCSATPEGRDYTVEDIRRWHRAQGWSDIGYHYVIYRDGSIHTGRDEDIAGAHCTGHNTDSIGICYIGGTSVDGKTPADTRTQQQREALRSLLAILLALYPGASIYGHRDFAQKACPSFDARREYADME